MKKGKGTMYTFFKTLHRAFFPMFRKDIQLISINIEGDKHIARIHKLIKKTHAEVICLQEIFEDDFESFKTTYGYEGVFVPMGYNNSFFHPPVFHNKLFGIGILVKFPITKTTTSYYIGTPEHIPIFETSDDTAIKPHTLNHLLLGVAFEYKEKTYRIFTTHFPVTPKGLPTTYQESAVTHILEFLKDQEPFVLCGDFNAPRGGVAFSRIKQYYKDNIPEIYKTSLDQDLHKTKGLQYMVDGLFSTSGYTCSDVRLQSGVSDHLAIIATIEKL
jgi:exonuclease III